MAGNCCSGGCATTAARGRYRRILWIALLINLAMFGVEIGAGVRSGSVSLLADSLDFFGDAANYGVSLFVLGLGVVMRARARSDARCGGKECGSACRLRGSPVH